MSIRSRVRAYEEAAAASDRFQKSGISPRTSLTFSSDDALTAASSSAPASPRANSVLEDLDSFVLTGTPSSSPSPTSFSPPQSKSPLGTKASMMMGVAPLISFASPPPPARSPLIKDGVGILASVNAAAPALPPRRPSTASLKSNNGPIPSLPLRRPSPNQPTGPSDTLGVAPNIPDPAEDDDGRTSRSRHSHALSSSSFQSLSLSDSGETTLSASHTVVPPQELSTKQRLNPPGIGLGGPPSKKAPPPIPERPSRISSLGSNAPEKPPISPVPYQTRRPAPPPPNTKTRPSPLTGSSHLIARKTPVPLPARMRYEELFDRQRQLAAARTRPQRTHSGWRGPSIDLRTTANPPENNRLPEKLDGPTVRRIWTCSKLDKRLLRDIWTECDAKKTGQLDREAFVQGMWRIDEELAKRAALRKPPAPRHPNVPYTVRR